MTAPTPFFADPAAASHLQSVATAWIGTPYAQSGAVRGAGCSCHCLAGAVLSEAGFPLGEVPRRGALRRSDFLAHMLAWLDARPSLFARLPLTPDFSPMLGDLLLADLGCGHAGLCLGGPGPRVLQVLATAPAHYASFADPALRAVLRAAYRPLAPVVEYPFAEASSANSAAEAAYILDVAAGYTVPGLD